MALPSVYQLPLFPTEKRCPHCRLVLPAKAFSIDGRVKSGLSSYCKQCRNAIHNLKSDLEAPERAAQQAARKAEKAARTEKACTKCGIIKPLSAFIPCDPRKGTLGCTTRCRECMRVYYWENREAIKAQRREKRKRLYEEAYAQGATGWQIWHKAVSERTEKRCNRCHEVKPLSEFYRSRSSVDGHEYVCKPCAREANAASESRQRYRKAYSLANAERNRARAQAHYRANPERHAIWRMMRRARAHHAEGSFTIADIRALAATQKNLCAYCTTPLGVDRHIDHIIPLARGGSNWPSNLCLACPWCNFHKHAKTGDEFRAWLTL